MKYYTDDEVQRLVGKAQSGDELAKEKLLMNWDHHIRRCASRIKVVDMDFDEKVLVGKLGLLAAIKAYRFDYVTKIKFFTFAYKYITGAIYEAKRDYYLKRGIPRLRYERGEAEILEISRDDPSAGVDWDEVTEDPKAIFSFAVVESGDLLDELMLIEDYTQGERAFIAFKLIEPDATYKEIGYAINVSESRAYQLHGQVRTKASRYLQTKLPTKRRSGALRAVAIDDYHALGLCASVD